MLAVAPRVIAHDLHPDYLSTRWALERDAEPVAVQHHHAHAAACLAEHGVAGPALALVFDGTGVRHRRHDLGRRAAAVRPAGFERVAHLDPVPLPGGEAAIREPWRVTAAYLARPAGPCRSTRWRLVRQSLAVNAPLSSGMGRLFDAVAALLGVRERVTYEGQAAIELEQLAGDSAAAPYAWRVDDGRSARGLLLAADDSAGRAAAHRDRGGVPRGGRPGGRDGVRAGGEPRTVVLSGGTFQNLRLLASTERLLAERGFGVLPHRRVPPNDGGISYGQAAVAAARLAAG